jgi:hypothetical protein
MQRGEKVDLLFWLAAAALAVALMPAADLVHDIEIVYKWAFFGLCSLIAAVCFGRAVYLTWRDESAAPRQEHKRKMIGLIGMAVCGVGFLGFATFYFWPQRSFELSTLSDQERFRRSMLLTKIRMDYIETNTNVSPMIQAGLENPPPEWTNRKLKQMGENWQVQSVVRKSNEPGLFVECSRAYFPIKAPSSGRIYALNLNAIPLAVGGGGMGEYTSQPDSEIKFGPEITEAHRCTISNYGPKPLINVAIGLYIIFQEKITDENNPNASRSGNVVAERPWRIDIKKIDPVPGNQFEFYIWNMTPNFAYVSFPDSATAEYIGNSERLEFRVSSTNSYPLSLPPRAEAQKTP